MTCSEKKNRPECRNDLYMGTCALHEGRWHKYHGQWWWRRSGLPHFAFGCIAPCSPLVCLKRTAHSSFFVITNITVSSTERNFVIWCRGSLSSRGMDRIVSWSLGLWHNNNNNNPCSSFYIIIIIIIIIIIKDTITFMQGIYIYIYTYIPETIHVPKQYSVAAILSLLCMVPISLALALALMYFYISTFRIICAVPSTAVFCSSLTSWFPGTVLKYFLNYCYYYYYYYDFRR
jgi:uncharacterized membrane protein YidH (DUF202 family)